MPPPLTRPFPSREELLQHKSWRKGAVEELYDLWRHAHAEAMTLAARLPEVFGDPPRPRITLHVARGLDDEWRLSAERWAELAALDPEQHWMEVSEEATRNFQEYFTFADEEGWRFYLPAFLRDYLGGFPIYGWDAVCIACAQEDRLESFTPAQLDFCRAFRALCLVWE